MIWLGLHLLDWIVLAAYFAIVLYLGVFIGAKKTKTLGDFFVAGGRWGALVSFVFCFASALAGNEAVVVSGKAYQVGLAGAWYWLNFIFATPIYYLFATYYRRARVYNLAEFLEMRYGVRVAAFYSLVAGLICMLFIGMFLLAVGNIVAGALGAKEHLQLCIWAIALPVAAYIYAGGMMSTVLVDLLQGVMCLVILGFLMLPYLWSAAGGFEALRARPPETWKLVGPGMDLSKVLALNLSAVVGGIAAPWIYNWIAISKDERTATQCAWAHVWKRILTLMFALYGILFAIVAPGEVKYDAIWGSVMVKILPIGAVGLMIASFFAAAMSSAASYATTSAAMLTDYFYRKVLRPGRTSAHYLEAARIWCVVSIVVAAVSTMFITEIRSFVELCLLLLCFLGVPIYFGVVWRRANRTGMWLALGAGVAYSLYVLATSSGDAGVFDNSGSKYAQTIFVLTGISLVGMTAGSLFGRREDETLLKRFYVIMNTPIGQEQRLVDVGIRLPALVDAGLVEDGPEQLKVEALSRMYAADAEQKIFGPASTVELRRERLGWYASGFVRVSVVCALMVLGIWLVPRWLFR